jgi:hypothetical protein
LRVERRTKNSSGSADATEAIEKMRKIGVEVPPGLQAIADEAKKAETATIDWKGALVSAAGAFGIAFSVNALKNFALGVLDTGAAIGDMSEKLGISAEAVQRFGYAADQSGASIETVDSAIKKMNANLAEGNTSTISALETAGLQFADIRRMAPEQAFIAIGDAVARIEDPMLRAQVATELFGKAGQELIPTFLAGIKQVGDATTVMADDTVKRLKDAQDAWARFKNAVVVASGEWIAEVEKDAQRWVAAVAAIGKPPVAAWEWFQSFRDQSGAAAQSASDLGAMAVSMVPPMQDFSERGLKPVALNADQVNAAIGYLDSTIIKATPTIAAHTAAVGADSTALFGWQQDLLLTKFKADQLTVSETELYDATDTLTIFIASHQVDVPEPP